MQSSPEEQVVRGLLAEVCATSPSAIAHDRLLVEYGLDSVRAMELVVGLESEFDLRISDADAREMRTLEDVVSYVQTRQTRRTAGT